ncbi:MAG: hypothetical protein NC339_01585 [Muribaculaceae bacterium]|nr:hypothetical protein [Muribaculaceae bacterium]
MTAFRLTLLTLLTVVCVGTMKSQTAQPSPDLPEGTPEGVDSVTTVTTVTTVTRTTWYKSKTTTDTVVPAKVDKVDVESPYVVPEEAPQPSYHYIDTINGYPVNEQGKIVIATINPELLNERVVVGNDTVPIILPATNYGRYDRGLFNFLFIPRGQWLFGLTASYGEFNSEDVQILSMLKDFNFKGKMYSVSPTFGYLFRNNQAVGMKFIYSRAIADLGGLAVDFDDDIDFTLSDISYYSQMYTASVFYRNYVGLGTEKRFAIFNEVDLAFGSGSSRFKRSYDGELRDTKTLTSKWSLNFSPGVTMFLMDNVCFNVSFGVFGIHYTHDRQYTNGVSEGSRTSSGANFKFNIFNINFGLGVCI